MVKMNDDDKRIFDARMAYYGYKSYKSDFFATDEYAKLQACIINHLPVKNDPRLKFAFCDKSDVLSAGKYVIEKHFNDIDLRVFCTNGDDLYTQVIARFGEKPKEEECSEIIKYIKNHLSFIKVTDIPVELDALKSTQNGRVSSLMFYASSKVNKSFFKKLPVCVRKLELSGPCNINSYSNYVHEMMHALFNRNKRNKKNYLNDEALSIFMERVAAKDLEDSNNLLELRILKRILDIKNNILEKSKNEFLEQKPEDIITREKYIVSTLHATALFDTYNKGSKKSQKEMDTTIGEVLIGHGKLEEVFEKYDATLEKGSKILQRQIKYFSK